jgi:uncharacterized pyridoxamine 5'-phosphate oxidase family protein
MPTPFTDKMGPAELLERALAVIQTDRLPYLATVEGHQPRLRPIAPVRTEGFTVYVANLRSTGKTAEIETNPRVELCYLDGHNDQVRITGLAEAVTDKALKEEIVNSSPYIRSHMGDAENPEFILYRIVPSRVRFMKEWTLTYHEVPFQRIAKDFDQA